MEASQILYDSKYGTAADPFYDANRPSTIPPRAVTRIRSMDDSALAAGQISCNTGYGTAADPFYDASRSSTPPAAMARKDRRFPREGFGCHRAIRNGVGSSDAAIACRTSSIPHWV
eukprot:TRINITY_DN46569_c0_g1_i1.p2 TRINITY_DN46569_c0_g1~~TRINITY_DN46569_c0_g1_i1.p2  ORF type:complete len:116 (-),score=14.16 TRINITY_DN46569_c0_g1_i1:93-440(-)